MLFLLLEMLNLFLHLKLHQYYQQFFDLQDFSNDHSISLTFLVWTRSIFPISTPSDCNPGAYGISGGSIQAIHLLCDWLSCLRAGKINLNSPLPIDWYAISTKPFSGHPLLERTTSKFLYPVEMLEGVAVVISLANHRSGC